MDRNKLFVIEASIPVAIDSQLKVSVASHTFPKDANNNKDFSTHNFEQPSLDAKACFRGIVMQDATLHRTFVVFCGYQGVRVQAAQRTAVLTEPAPSGCCTKGGLGQDSLGGL